MKQLLLTLLALCTGCGEQEPPATPPPPPSAPVALPPEPPVNMNPRNLPHGQTLDESAFSALLKTPGAKYTVVTIFAADCAPCIAESKHLGPLMEVWRKRKVTLIGISADVTVERIDKFLKQVGEPQTYPMYLAPWFIEQHKIDGTPVLMLFKPDGSLLLKVSVDETPEPLKALEKKLDEIQAGSVETTPNAANDPGATLDQWRIDQLDAAEERLPELLKGVETIVTDRPAGGTGPEDLAALTRRYRPCLTLPGVQFGWVEKRWPGKDGMQGIIVKSTDEGNPLISPAGAMQIGAGRSVPAVGGQPNRPAELGVWYDRSAKRSLIVVQMTIVPDVKQAAELTAANLNPQHCITRIVLWLSGEEAPDVSMPMIEALARPAK